MPRINALLADRFVITFKELRDNDVLYWTRIRLFTHWRWFRTHHLPLCPCDGGTRTPQGCAILRLGYWAWTTSVLHYRNHHSAESKCAVCFVEIRTLEKKPFFNKSWRLKGLCMFLVDLSRAPALHSEDGSKPGEWDNRWTSWRRICDLDLNKPWSLLTQLEVK